MSDSVRPQRRQPTRLPHPWDSPGKNTGVCHFLLQGMKVKSESEVAQSCPTLCDPMDCSPPGSSALGIFQARVLEWGAIAFPVFKVQRWVKVLSLPRHPNMNLSQKPLTEWSSQCGGMTQAWIKSFFVSRCLKQDVYFHDLSDWMHLTCVFSSLTIYPCLIMHFLMMYKVFH